MYTIMVLIRTRRKIIATYQSRWLQY